MTRSASLTGATDLMGLEVPSLLQRVGYAVTTPFKNWILPTTWLKRLVATSRSPLISEGRIRPGGWRSMELIYANQEPVDTLDRQALRDNPISIASRNRRQLVTQILTELLVGLRSRPHVTILGVGAGPGRHVQAAILKSGLDPLRVAAYLIDRDNDAFEFGRELADQSGLGQSIHFVQGDARGVRDVLPNVSIHVFKLIGLVEYLTDTELKELLGALHTVAAPGASLVTNGLVDVYHTRPFLSRVFNLRHHIRTAAQMEALLATGGFRTIDCQTEPTGIYPVLTAVV